MFLIIICGLFLGFLGLNSFLAGVGAIARSQNSIFFAKLAKKVEQELKNRKIGRQKIMIDELESLPKRMLWSGIFQIVVGVILILLAAWILQKL